MNVRLQTLLAGLGLAAALGACEVFEDLTPENITFAVDGAAGAQVRLVTSKQFVAGVTEAGVTQVSLFVSDTSITTLPLDRTVSIDVERQFFFEVTPVEADVANVRVRVNVDGRGLLDESGDVFAENPFRYIYLFNQPATRVIEVF